MPSPWAGSTLAVPVNQIDALPVLSVQQFIDAGGAQGIVFGGRVLKYWDPAALALDGVLPQHFRAKWHLTTPWLDVSPCLFFSVLVNRFLPTHAVAYPAVASVKLFVQSKLSAADNPPLSFELDGAGTSVNDAFNGFYPIVTNGIAFPAVAINTGAPETQRYLFSVSPDGGGVGGSMNFATLALGPWVRFQLNWSTNDPTAGEPAGANQSTYTMAIIGSS